MTFVHALRHARPRRSRIPVVTTVLSTLSVLSVLTVAAWAAGTLLAQPTGSISGRVATLTNGEPIMFATVQVDSTVWSTQTDINGFFALSGVTPGTYSVTVKFLGFEPQTRENVNVLADSTTTIDFHLMEMKVEGEAVVVAEPTHFRKGEQDSKDHSAKGDRVGTASAPSANEALSTDAFLARRNDRATVGCVAPSPMTCFEPWIGPRYGTDFNTEEYVPLGENRFLEVVGNPLSTFSIDVDVASYGNMRRFIRGENLPPKDAVRIEELINYFDYNYPIPDGEHPFSVTVEQSDCPWQEGHRLVHIGLQGQKFTGEELPASNLVFLIDVSGSMQPENKLPLVQKAFGLLVNQLRASDRVAIVVYAGAAGAVLPSTRGSEKQKIHEAIGRLSAGGSTAGAAGIQLAYQIAQQNFIRGGNNRIILATDGDFNVGTSSTGELVQLIEDKRKAGVFLTILGFGMGNLKDSRLEQLADKGNGNYAYIDNMREAHKVFVTELTGTLFTIAKDVKLQIEFNPARVASYRLIGYENRMLAKEDFADDKVDSGELGAGHTVTALYEIVPAKPGTRITGDELRYQSQGARPDALESDEVLTLKLRYKQPDGETSRLMVVPVGDRPVELANSSNDFRFSAAVAEFGLLLRDSEHKGKASWPQVLELAKGSIGSDHEGFRTEFVDLVHNASRLTSMQASR